MNRLFFLLIMIGLTSCKRCKEVNNDDELCSNRTSNISGALKLDGYYYRNIPNGKSLVFLYNNGVAVFEGKVTEEELNNLESHLYQHGYYNGDITSKMFCGIYSITDSKISYERWHAGNNKLYVYKRSGDILNDTTFVIKTVSRCDGSEQSAENEVYHFKQFSPKPDSTNSFTN